MSLHTLPEGKTSRSVALICIESQISDWIIIASCYYALANICGAIQRVGSGSLQPSMDQDITLRKISTVTFFFIYTFGWVGEWTPRLTQPVDSLVPRPMFSQQQMYYITAALRDKFSRSGDVIHPQLWESGSGYETNQ